MIIPLKEFKSGWFVNTKGIPLRYKNTIYLCAKFGYKLQNV